MRALGLQHMDTALVHDANLALRRSYKRQRNTPKSGDRNATNADLCENVQSARAQRTCTHRHVRAQAHTQTHRPIT